MFVIGTDAPQIGQRCRSRVVCTARQLGILYRGLDRLVKLVRHGDRLTVRRVERRQFTLFAGAT